jgi:hypothetical protein
MPRLLLGGKMPPPLWRKQKARAVFEPHGLEFIQD